MLTVCWELQQVVSRPMVQQKNQHNRPWCRWVSVTEVRKPARCSPGQGENSSPAQPLQALLPPLT